MDEESLEMQKLAQVHVMSQQQSETWGARLPEVKPRPLTLSNLDSCLSELGKTFLTAGTLVPLSLPRSRHALRLGELMTAQASDQVLPKILPMNLSWSCSFMGLGVSPL